MAKEAISVTLAADNLAWLRGRALAKGARSISEMLDGLIRDARTGGKHAPSAIRSAVGTVRIASDDPDLLGADAAVRAWFDAALGGRRAQRRRRKRRG